jgi:thiol-disulfide isomerase/thioredoxin
MTAFPEDRLETSDGNGFAIASHEGAFILNFWATWCAPCVHELPALAKAAEKLSQDEVPISVVLISVDRKGADHAQNFLDERDIDIQGVISAFNPTSTWPRALGLSGLPSTYLIGADRTDIYLLHGPADWADEAVLSQVRALIGG